MTRSTGPVHHDDDGVFRSPLGDSLDEWRSRRLDGVVRVVQRGQTVSLARGDGPDGAVELSV